MSLSHAEKLIIAEARDHIRLSSVAAWTKHGTCVMQKINKFDSFGKAGIAAGDELIAVNGALPASEMTFLLTVGKLGVGSTVPIRVRRGGQELDIEVKLLKKRKLNFDIEEAQVDLERKIAPA